MRPKLLALQNFTETERRLVHAALLRHPRKNTIHAIHIDASDIAMGTVLEQHVITSRFSFLENSTLKYVRSRIVSDLQQFKERSGLGRRQTSNNKDVP